MGKSQKYILSFTGASLRLNEMVKIAKTANESGVSNYNELKGKGIAFNSVKLKTSDTEFREIRYRLEKLTKEQIQILINGDLISQKQIAYLGVCKYYDIIRDFAIDVVRDKSLIFDYTVNDSDFKSFLANKTPLHPELEEFSDSTLKKAKQVIFRILEQAGIINNSSDKIIQPQILQQGVIDAIVKDDPAWLRIFMLSDKDIEQIRH